MKAYEYIISKQIQWAYRDSIMLTGDKGNWGRKAYGQGLKLLDYPEIKVFNLDPSLLEKMNVKEINDGTIEVPVTCEIPAKLMGN